MKSIEHIFPGAIRQKEKFSHQEYEIYFDQITNEYIGIPKDHLTEREVQLLNLLYTYVESPKPYLNINRDQKEWYQYLFENGPKPSLSTERIRYIQFYITTPNSGQSFIEAASAFFPENLQIVWIDEQNGIIVGRESIDQIHDDLSSFKEALLSDFYMNAYFYVGRFYDSNSDLKSHYAREQTYFQISKPYMKKDHIYRFEQAFPLVLLSLKGIELKNILQAEWEDIFQNDLELVSTIKLFLENNSNTSLTAKKLYLHRNSLQYRIDKFIERTTIDIKLFQGALSVYFICLYGSHFEHHY